MDDVRQPVLMPKVAFCRLCPVGQETTTSVVVSELLELLMRNQDVEAVHHKHH